VKKMFFILWAVLFFMPFTAMGETVTFVTDDFPPYGYIENGEVKGISADIIREVCRRADIQAKFQVISWQRAIKSMKDGSADGIFYLHRNEEREKFLFFPSEPVALPKMACFVLKTGNIKIEKLEDLKGRNCGVIGDYSYGTEFDRFGDTRKIPCKDLKELIKLLEVGRIDTAVSEEMSFRYLSRELGLQDKFETAYVITQNPVYVAFSQKNTQKGAELAGIFSRILPQLQEDGTAEKIADEYVKKH